MSKAGRSSIDVWSRNVSATVPAFSLIVLLIVGACTSGGSDDSGAPTVPPTQSPGITEKEFEETKVEIYEKGVEFPVDMAWEVDTERIFFTEKNTGYVRVMLGKRLLPEPCVRLNVATDLLEGLTGIVLHPDFEQNRWLYVFYTNKKPHENRLTRFAVDGNRCTDPQHLLTGLSPSRVHNGGQLEFVEDYLFVGTGEANMRTLAQDLSSPLGKILRLNDDGSVPDGNPFSEPGKPSPVWSLGHRNPFGLAVKPGTDLLFQTENGPECDDELNLIERGANYGWGKLYRCGEPVGTDPRPPLMSWTPPIVPADLWWYEGELETLSGALFMAEYVQGRVHRFEMSEDGTRILSSIVVYDSDEKLVDVSEGPGGYLYFLTQENILRMVPAD